MRAFLFVAAAVGLAAVPARVAAQGRQDLTTVIDSIAVLGARRIPPAQVRATAAIPVHRAISYRDVQRAILALYATGQYDDVRVTQGTVDGKEVLRIRVVELPLLTRWTVRGADKLSEHSVRGKVRLDEGRAYDREAAYRSAAAIDSLYAKSGYYLAHVRLRELPQDDGTMHVIFDVDEGHRVAISNVRVQGNHAFSAGDIVGHMKTKPEGFWWFQRGEYNEDKLDRDLRERLPAFYASHGYIDFHVLKDTLLVAPGTGKGTLVLNVDEGPKYTVGSFEILGNRQFSSDQLKQFYPFGKHASGFLGLGGTSEGPAIFDEDAWQQATQHLQTLYGNNGFLYADIRPVVTRHTHKDGTHTVDLRWQINEGQPATIHMINIRGNTVTHEGVIRRAIVLVPGDVLRQDLLIRSYQNVSNLRFFQQPMTPPKIDPANPQEPYDVNVTFNVEERRTGNINFGASVGQGTGLGGFIGLDEPNVLGRGKRISLQWQFGQNISDFNITYTDPAIRGSLISGALSVHSSLLRYTIADLGQIRTRGGSLQLGFPFFGSRYTRILGTYTLEQENYQSAALASQFYCANCILSSFGLSLVRDTRIGLPFPTGGALHQASIAQGGGPLGGSGDFRRATFEGRWYAPLATLGGNGGTGPGAGGMKLLIGFSTQAGFVWGDPGPHFRQLFAMGGTQFGIPLRGYDEFSITPQGFDPAASTTSASTVKAFGRSYFEMTGEIGLRISQALYLNTFYDAGNVWARPSQFDPTRLFRGAGIGLSVLSPLGPLGIDYAYGFDKTDSNGNPAPGWKLHFKIGNFY